MRKAAAGLSALVVSAAMLMGPAIAERKPISPAAPHAKASSALRIASEQTAPASGFAKTTRGKTAAPKKAGAQQHASARTKGSHAKKGHSRGDEAKVRPKQANQLARVRPVPQAPGSVAGFLTGWPLTRPGSPGRLGGNHANHPYGGFIGWFGPVFWPYAYDDMFAYLFWPLDAFDDGETFWAFAYDDLLEGTFWASAEVATERDAIVATADADILASDDRSRAGVLGLDGRSREFAQICGDRAPGLIQWPILRIAQSIGITREQRSALKDLQIAAGVLKSACPLEMPTTAVGRLDAMQDRVEAMLHALDLLRPPVQKFYDPLTDAQKARFQATGSPAANAAEAAASASGENELVPQICTDHPAGLSVQTVDRLEGVVRPTEAQRAALDELRTAAARAAQALRDACPAGTPANPPERLAAMQQRLGAMLDAANTVRPVLQNFYGLLTDLQKARFNAIGKQAGR
jgi:hypothetical protein